MYELATGKLPSLQDETLEDWDDVLPFASLTHSDFENWPTRPEIDPSSLAWRIFLAWHNKSQTLYFAMERVDNDYIGPADDRFLRERVEVSIDGDHSGGQFAFFEGSEDRLWNSQAQSYWLMPEPFDSPPSLLHVATGARWPALEPWSEIGGTQFGADPNYAVIEAKLTPWDALSLEGPEASSRSVLLPGRIVGLQVLVYDRDRFPTDESAVFSLAFSESMRQADASYFVDAELIPCTVGDCSQAKGSAVEGVSWGRIKAAMIVASPTANRPLLADNKLRARRPLQSERRPSGVAVPP